MTDSGVRLYLTARGNHLLHATSPASRGCSESAISPDNACWTERKYQDLPTHGDKADHFLQLSSDGSERFLLEQCSSQISHRLFTLPVKVFKQKLMKGNPGTRISVLTIRSRRYTGGYNTAQHRLCIIP